MKRTLDPIKPQTPDASKIMCMTCEHRDKFALRIRDKIVPVGATKIYCSEYNSGTGKPYDVLFANAKCPRYKKENV